MTTACIHDTVDVSIENDEEKSSQAENGRASPEGGSGYGEGGEVHFRVWKAEGE